MAEAEPAEAEATDNLRQGLLEAFTHELGDQVVGHHVKPGDDLWVRVTSEAWRAAGEVAKAKLGCSYFCFLSAIDWQPSPAGRNEVSPLDPDPDEDADLTPVPGYAGGESRFQVFARVVKPGRDGTGYGVTLKADLDDDEPRVATWIPVYAGANWHEREAWEMYGIAFDGHPNLTHLYLPGAFEGHPLRKDFPLLAREVKPWPGIVDVEPMPEGDEEPAEEAGEEPAGAADERSSA